MRFLVTNTFHNTEKEIALKERFAKDIDADGGIVASLNFEINNHTGHAPYAKRKLREIKNLCGSPECRCGAFVNFEEI